MTSPHEAGRHDAGGRSQEAGGRSQETVRRAKRHLSTASNLLDSAATAITRARELADERDGAGDELAEDIAAVRSSAQMLVDVLSE